MLRRIAIVAGDRLGNDQIHQRLAFTAPALYYLFRPGDIAPVAERLAFIVVGILYGGLSFAFIAFIKRDFGPVGADTILLVLTTAWLSDTGGYVGRAPTGRPTEEWAVTIMHFERDRVVDEWVGADKLGLFIQLGVIDDPWPT